MPTKKTSGFLPRRSARIAAEKKKKCLKNFTRQISTVLDKIPLEIIKYDIFPFLDYQARISFNQCLPPWDRIQTTMSPQSIKKHNINYCIKKAGSMLTSLEEKDACGTWKYHGDRRIQRMIQVFNLFLKDEYFSIYTSFGNFRTVFSAKIDEMQQLVHRERSGMHQPIYSNTWLDELVSMCNSLRDKILNYTGELRNISLDTIPALKFT